MSRDFTKISPAVWTSPRFIGLSDRGRLAYLYFLSNGHINSSGCYRLPDLYAASDLNWPVEEYAEARAEVIAAGLAEHDPETAEILITRWFKHNGLMNEKHATGTRKFVASIESDRLRELTEAAFTEAESARVSALEAKETARQMRRLAANDALKGATGSAFPTDRLANTSFMRGGRAV